MGPRTGPYTTQAPPWTRMTYALQDPRQGRPQSEEEEEPHPGFSPPVSQVWSCTHPKKRRWHSSKPCNPFHRPTPSNSRPPQTECEPKIPISTSQQLSSSSAFTSECQKQPIPMVPKQTRRSNERTPGELNLAEAVNHNRMNQAKLAKKLGAEAPQKYYLNVLD